MFKKEKSIEAFDKLINIMRELIFSPQKREYMSDIYKMKLTEVSNNQKPILKLFQNLQYFEKGDYTSFITNQKKILTDFQKSETHIYFGLVGRFFIGIANNILGNYIEALAIMQQCHLEAKQKKYDRMVAEIGTGLGHIFSEYGYLKIASHYFEESCLWAKENEVNSLLTINGFGLIKLHYDQQNTSKVKFHIDELKNVIEHSSIPMLLNYTRWSIEYYILLNDWKNAKKQREHFEAQKGEFFNPYFFIAIYIIDAKLAAHKKKFDESMTQIEKGIDAAKSIQSTSAESIVYREAALILMQSKQHTEAEKYLNKSLQLAKSMNSNIALSFTYEYLHLLSLEIGQIEKALNYFKEYHHYAGLMIQDDERINTELLKSLTMLKQKDQTINTLKSELNEKTDKLQTAQYLLAQKKKVIDEVNDFMKSIKEQNQYTNKAITQLQKRLNESALFELNTSEMSQALNTETQQWISAFSKKHPSMSKTESKIAFYIAKGHSNKEIANILFCSLKNIEQTKYRIKKKINSSVSLDEYLKSLGV